MLDVHRQAFIEEATELIADLESSLLELESNSTDAELIAKVFRAMHTIKGSSAMFGFDGIAMFTHDVESVYDYIRKGQLAVSSSIIDITLAACDQVGKMLKTNDALLPADEEKASELLKAFKKIAASCSTEKKEEQIKPQATLPAEAGEAEIRPVSLYHITFKPSEQILVTGSNPLLLIAELRDMGESVVITNTSAVPEIDVINPEYCYLSWEVILFTRSSLNTIKDVFIFVEGDSELHISKIKEVKEIPAAETLDDIGLHFSSASLTPGFIPVEFLTNYFSEKAQGEKGQSGIKKTEAAESHGHETDAASSIRVSADKLDELVNLVGELVTIQARLSQLAMTAESAQMSAVSEEVERITWSLRDSALNIRMLPIGTTFSKFKRLVRSLSKELGKEVELTTEGAETELDKTVIEKMSDPLVHIIRNSIDHGIETPEQRISAGKPAVGIVHLSASQAGGNVIIKISDDGAGLNKDVIRQKAVSNGLASENAELSDNEIYTMIFMPGFSTAKTVTNVSGRGVGMDVVRKAIQGLRGTVEVQSQLGVGTTILLKLPLTLAIIDGLLVGIAGSSYILPLSSVEECIELLAGDRERSNNRNLVNVRGELVPYIDLRQHFMLAGKRPDIEQIVIAGINSMRVGFVVDHVIGQHQTVLKSLGKVFRNVEGVSGATILGDGKVALILDINKLVEKAEMEERMEHA